MEYFGVGQRERGCATGLEEAPINLHEQSLGFPAPLTARWRNAYRDLVKRLAQESIEVAEAEVETITREAERVSGFPVQFEEGDFGVQMTASTEVAWKHGRDHHVIRVRESLDAAVKLHMRAHELCHILMETEARNAGTNRWFSSNESGWQLAQREIANELGPIRRTLPPTRAQELIERLFKGLMAQLYNLPLDMLIERRIATRHPVGLAISRMQRC